MAEAIDSADWRNVLREQLDFLLEHGKQQTKCWGDCEHCARLKHVQFWLMQPFTIRTR